MKKSLKIATVCVTVLALILSGCPVFASETNLPQRDTDEYFIPSVDEANSEASAQFIEEKLSLAEQKMLHYNTNFELKGIGIVEDYIDLGDGCYIKIKAEDVPENSFANTPGVETLWKDYGNRKFKVSYTVMLAVVYYEMVFINHYTLSSTGIKVRSGEAWVNDAGFAHSEVGEVKTTKSSAKIGETVSMNCIFKLGTGLGSGGASRNFKMLNKVKCSDIDTIDKQVKVVQSWSGKWL